MFLDLSTLTDPYNLPYLLTLGAYIIHEMLGLRAVLAAAHIGFLVLAIQGGHSAGVLWNVVFVSINSWHVARILWLRRKVSFEPTVEALYQNVFAVMTRLEFRQFWNLGKDVVLQGTWLEEGRQPDSLFVIVEGEVGVTKGGADINLLRSGRFFAEMGYLTRHPASATVVSRESIRCHQWTYDGLEAVERDQPELWVKVQAILGREMALKIAEQNPKVAPGLEPPQSTSASITPDRG